MAGLGRFTAVLRLFDEDRSVWSVPAMSDVLGVPASTLYRTVRELVAEGFLDAADDARYRLGPAFIEFDWRMRRSDPLVRAGAPVLSDVVHQADVACVALLSRLYNGTVMCVADEAAPDIAFRSSYERGRPMPLARGATSKVILAHLQPRQLTRLIGPRENSGPLRAELNAIRKRGYLATANEVDEGLAGIAAPVIDRDAGVVASLSLVTPDAGLDDAQRRRLVLLCVSAAGMLSEELQKLHANGAGGEQAA